MSWTHSIAQALQQAEQQQACRTRTVHRAADVLPHVHINGQRYLNFAGNDYLGFSRQPAVLAAWQQALTEYGGGSGASGHVLGLTEVHEATAAELARFLGYERALLIGSGYAANQALAQALGRLPVSWLLDKYCHASLQEGVAQSGRPWRRYPHLQHGILAARLASARQDGRLYAVATEGVFSMDGDQPDLVALRRLCDRHGAWLVVDDAHGFGVCGPQGRGSAAAAGVQADVLLVTFGKALGLAGAALLCRAHSADYLWQYARHLIYSTAMPPAQAAAVGEAVRQLAAADAARARLAAHIAHFRRGMAALSLPANMRLLPAATAIQPVYCGDNAAVLAAAEALRRQGIWVGAIRPPTVPPGQGRLRITLSAAHATAHIDALLAALEGLAHA